MKNHYQVSKFLDRYSRIGELISENISHFQRRVSKKLKFKYVDYKNACFVYLLLNVACVLVCDINC